MTSEEISDFVLKNAWYRDSTSKNIFPLNNTTPINWLRLTLSNNGAGNVRWNALKLGHFSAFYLRRWRINLIWVIGVVLFNGKLPVCFTSIKEIDAQKTNSFSYCFSKFSFLIISYFLTRDRRGVQIYFFQIQSILHNYYLST